MKRRTAVAAALLAAAAVVLGGCAPYAVDHPLDAVDPQKGYRLATLADDGGEADRLFVILSFSGGGHRAAALAYGVMEHLRDTRVPGTGRSLLDEVDVISSVSGGSFTAAYFALFRDRLFTDFRPALLDRNLQGRLIARLFNPVNWVRLASPRFDRIDLAAETYHRRIFQQATYGDLAAGARRPFVIVNSTDMAIGARFEFTQDQFDPLCQDLSALPVAHAVAASSAFPFLLTPITVPSAAGTCRYPDPEWLDEALEDRQANERRFYAALGFLTYLEAGHPLRSQYFDPANPKRFVHLLDGGISDNIGLRGPIQSMRSLDPAWSVMRQIDLERIDRLVLIVVNARSGGEVRWNRHRNAPRIHNVFRTVTGAPMANYSFETVELARAQAAEDDLAQRMTDDCERLLDQTCGAPLPIPKPHPVAFYTVEVDFDAVADPVKRRRLKTLGTAFNLPPGAVDLLRETAHTVLDESADLQRLLDDLEPAAVP